MFIEKTEIYDIDPDNPDVTVLERAAEIIRGGGIVVYPTDTLYGFGVDARNQVAVNRLYALKGRDENKPVSLIVKNLNQAESIVGNLYEYERTIFRKLLPGKITLILKKRKNTDEIINGEKERNFFDNSNYLNVFAKATFDSYSTKYFPKKGFYFDSNYKLYLISSDYNNKFNSFSQVYGNIGYAYTFFDKLTLHATSEAGITIGSSGNSVHDYHLGGNNENFINTFFPFYGYEVGGLNGSSFLLSGLTIRYEVYKKNYISPNE